MPRDVHPIPFVIHPSDELAKNIDLKSLSRNLATKYADGHVVTDDDLQIMGRNLWNGLSAQAQGAFEVARKEAGEKILPVVIHSDAADVQALPWETLFHPTYGFIGKNPDFTLTRRISAQEAAGGLDQGPLRVLLFTSLPVNVDPERSRLKVEEEQAEVQAALLPWIAQGLVTFEMPDDGRFFTLQNLLKEFQPHVLFLSGHGNFHHMPHAKEAYGEFFFEDEAGDSMGVKEDEIADALRGTGVQAVILSACESGRSASDELSNGLTRKISAAGITHVVGMREAIYDVAGIQFARALCNSLARQERMDVALQAARIAIQTPFKDVARASSSIGDELSYGQWCLPLLISSAPSRALIDWDFTPRQVEARAVGQKLNTVVMPARFIGRRAEMRKYKNSLLAGKIHTLLITGPGGQGKTSLAGKLALDLQTHGYRIFAWSARPENSWRDFELEMEQTLDRPRVDRYDKFLPHCEDESTRARFMLDLLMEQFDGRVVLFLDNIETIQDPDTLALKDATVEAWLRAANQAQGMILLVTSRWQIPDWDGEHEPLTHVNYGDFLQIAQRLSLPPAFLTQRSSLRQVYDILGGNVRGLEFFAAAVRDMENADEENTFLEKLSTVKEDLQANMAIEAIYNRLPANAQTLLHRLPAFREPVPMEGLLKLAPDLPNPESLLERLLAVSLLEASYEPHWKVNEYQCPQMVVDWMWEKGLVNDSHEWLNAVADYHVYLHTNERKTLSHAITTHHALHLANRNDEADRLALDYIIGSLALTGLYNALLIKWLPRICESNNLQTRSDALNQKGEALFTLREYEKANASFKEALAIKEELKDLIGQSASLNNISQIFHEQGEYESALMLLHKALVISREAGDKEGEGSRLINIGKTYYTKGDYDVALSFCEQALEIQDEIYDELGKSITFNIISSIYLALGDYDASISYATKTLVISRQFGDQISENTALNSISQIYQSKGEYEISLSYLRKSLLISRQLGDKLRESRSLNNIGQNCLSQNNYELALTYFDEALIIAAQINDRLGQSSILNNVSVIYLIQGDFVRAFSNLQEALKLSQQIGDKAGEIRALINTSTYYYNQKNYSEALSCLVQAQHLNKQLGKKMEEAVLLNNISQIHQIKKDFSAAMHTLNNALLIQKEIGDMFNLGTTLNNIAALHHAQGEFDLSLTYLEQAITIQREIGDLVGLSRSLINKGVAYVQLGRIQDALSDLSASYIIAKEMQFDQVLQALPKIASQLDLPESLDVWEMISRNIQRGEYIDLNKYKIRRSIFNDITSFIQNMFKLK